MYINILTNISLETEEQTIAVLSKHRSKDIAIRTILQDAYDMYNWGQLEEEDIDMVEDYMDSMKSNIETKGIWRFDDGCGVDIWLWAIVEV